MKCVYPQIAGCLCAQMSRGLTGQEANNDLIAVFTSSPSNEWANTRRGGVSSNLMARDYKSASDLVVEEQKRKSIVRRLTPLECCRLQGFPDFWEDGVSGSDSARYKLWGNGIALPCAYDVLNKIANELRK